MSQWFRAYSEVLNDPKIQTLPLDAFKAWHNALYLAASLSSNDGSIGTLEDVSFAFRETKESVSSAFHHLVERGLIETLHGTFRIVSWRKRQFKSDTSTARVRKHRVKMKRSGNVTETAPETDTETEQNTPKGDASRSPEKIFWDGAVSYLGASKRGLIGKWRKQYGIEETKRAITAAQVDQVIDPVSFIEACLRRRKEKDDDPFANYML